MDKFTITNPDAAKYVSDLLLSINGQLISSLDSVKSDCSPEEFHLYRKGVYTLVNSIFEGLLEPIYSTHPSLKPQRLDM